MSNERKAWWAEPWWPIDLNSDAQAKKYCAAVFAILIMLTMCGKWYQAHNPCKFSRGFSWVRSCAEHSPILECRKRAKQLGYSAPAECFKVPEKSSNLSE